MHDLVSLWHLHREARWPTFTDLNEGQLMTLDTVISGCVTYYLESENGLDPQRVEILESCLADLNGLLPDLAAEASPYFDRLRTLATMLLATRHRP
ncbi:MAG: hypothetical protein E6K58_03705 [Nitrospirae bacterium]|nr:MAG: hypothetical protein AUH21_06680 [Nitrospirae bacterium 13_2_20CM_62_7]OLB55144.1 MAG: hypothetical protein AUI03_08100 [Nitrospirae bacterium 13_2_20CM_2_62_8]TLY44127.1 MAG: hypothetical protein E6K58_03705 [Nitrospirota bacterium]